MATWQDPETFAIWIIIMILIVGGLTTSITLLMQKYYKRMLINNEELAAIKLSHQQQLAADSIKAQEKERKRISLTLHDDLISNLNIALFSVKAGLNTPKYQKILENCIHTARQISHDLSPPLIEENNITELLNAQFDLLLLQNQLEINVIRKNDQVLNKSQKIQVIRIAQEIISNIIKHAQAKLAIINIRFSSQLFFMQIADDGLGFDFNKQSNGLGLSNISLRTQLLNGKSKFKKRNPNGTAFILSFPFQTSNTNLSIKGRF